MLVRTTVSTAAALLFLAGVARAQSPAGGGNLQAHLPTGEKIVVTTTDGERLEGRLRSSAADVLSLDAPSGLRMIEMRRVDRIVVKDSVRNGLLIGLAIGAGAGVAVGRVADSICFGETDCSSDVTLLLGVIGAAGGAAIGAGLDGLRHRTAFERGRGSPGIELVLDLWPVTQARSSDRGSVPYVSARFTTAPSVLDQRTHRAAVAISGGLGLRW
jgi:hypothetical protein